MTVGLAALTTGRGMMVPSGSSTICFCCILLSTRIVLAAFTGALLHVAASTEDTSGAGDVSRGAREAVVGGVCRI